MTDDTIPSLVPQKKKRIRRIKPTIKQIKSLQYISQGHSTRKAMILAGYSPKQANKSNTYLFGMKGAREALESMTAHLARVGLTTEYMAGKVREFVDAKKIDHSHTEPDKEVPDYRTQIEGVKLWRDILEKNVNGVKGTKKREVTLTEWITGEEDQVQNA